MQEPQRVGRTTGRLTLFLCQYHVKSLTRCHHDMVNDIATSDVKSTGGNKQPSLCVGLASNALPEVQSPNRPANLQTGVSTINTPSGNVELKQKLDDIPHWYVLRTTYSREKKAYNYLTSKNIKAFYPTVKRIKIVAGKRVTTEVSRIPNIFFAYATLEELKTFVYDNTYLPFLRFYYHRKHFGKEVIDVPLVVPDSQMETLKMICASDAEDIICIPEAIDKFKKGQRVRIIEGKFKGITGVFARYHSQQRVGIVINGLLTACTAYIPSAFIELIE